MKTVLITDTETTGLDKNTDQVIEIATVLYSLEHASVLTTWSTLLHAEDNGAECINHIPAALVRECNTSASVAWNRVEAECGAADAVLAHNARFDKQWVPKECTDLLGKPWIDTCRAVEWPLETKPGSNLINLALGHGLGIVDAHRALSDCLLLARLMTRVIELGYDIQEILARGLRPMGTFEACVSYEHRSQATNAGFHWNKLRKQWLREMALEDAAVFSAFRLKQTKGED